MGVREHIAISSFFLESFALFIPAKLSFFAVAENSPLAWVSTEGNSVCKKVFQNVCFH